MPQPVDFLFTHAAVICMDPARRILADGAVAVQGDAIAWVGPAAEAAALFDARQTLDLAGMALIPGLINTHGHWAMTLYRGLIDDVHLEAWLDKIWAVERQFNSPENVAAGTRLAIVEMLHSGTTCAADMYWQYGSVTRAAGAAGFRMVNGPSFTEILGFEDMQNVTRQGALEYLEANRANPLLRLCVQAHSTYTTSRAQLEYVRGLAEQYGLLFITHASESRGEVQTVREKYGKTPIEVLDDSGLLGPQTLLAHCVHLTDAEIARLAETGTAVSHCPSSNLKLSSGIARVADLLRAGVTVSLGTDGPASNNDLNLFAEGQLAALVQKGVTGDPTVLPAEQVFAMLTIDGARAIGMGEQLGSIEAGKLADLAVIDFDAPNLTPCYDWYSNLVYAAAPANVRHVMINGKLVMQDRQTLTLDEEAVKADVRAIAEQIRGA